MSQEIDPALNTATSALVAAAVDGASKSASGATTADHATDCLNCHTPLQGDYCHACGQAAHNHRTLHGFVHDLLHGAFHFEGRIWHTLPMLVFRPGTLTRRYIDGKRAHFVSPVALFLFLVFLTFAIMSFGGEGHSGPMLETAKSTAAEQARPESQVASKDGQELVKVIEDPKDRDFSIDTGNALVDKKIEKIVKNPDLYAYKLKSSAYKYLWILIPLSLPFIWLMFAWKRALTLYDHSVFATYSLCAMMLLMITTHLISLIGGPDPLIFMVLAFAPPVHMFFQIKGAYGVSVFGAIWRVLFLLMSAGITVTLFAGLLLVSAVL